MKKKLIPTVVMLGLLITGTAMANGRRPAVDVVVSIPLLPPIVELREEPYYNHSGYYYFFDNDRWYYARSKGGPWVDLPRGHYPKETRYKGKSRHHDRDERDHDDRDNDKHDRDEQDNDDRDKNKHDRDERDHDNRR